MGLLRGVYLGCDQPGCSADTDDTPELRGMRVVYELLEAATKAGWQIDKGRGGKPDRHYCPLHRSTPISKEA